jgi:hypothetical protein
MINLVTAAEYSTVNRLKKDKIEFGKLECIFWSEGWINLQKNCINV